MSTLCSQALRLQSILDSRDWRKRQSMCQWWYRTRQWVKITHIYDTRPWQSPSTSFIIEYTIETQTALPTTFPSRTSSSIWAKQMEQIAGNRDNISGNDSGNNVSGICAVLSVCGNRSEYIVVVRRYMVMFSSTQIQQKTAWLNLHL